mgnify:FL=1
MQIIFQLKPVDYEQSLRDKAKGAKHFDLCRECFVAAALKRTL